MSFTNSTTNYGLPQYISTDIPSYLVDQNGAWATIDSALKSASDDATQAINDASTADGKAVTAQTDASSALTKANGALSNIADTFDSTSTYSVGDRVIYNSILYVCSTAVTIPGAFDPVNWTRETIEEEIDNINSDIATINSNLTELQNNDLDTHIDLSSISNAYTFTTDGYLILTSSLNSDVVVRLYGDSNDNNHFNLSSVYDYTALFVRKGMRVAKISSTGTYSIQFVPLV